MNMQAKSSSNCTVENAGVDLNRNYGYKWGEGQVDAAECQEMEAYPGKEAFSEPETRAIRDFLKSTPNIKFVFNFHSAGKMMVTPINAEVPMALKSKFPEIHEIFTEFTNEVQFPDQTDIGPASESVGITVGGSAGDWIVNELHIPAVEPEIGFFSDIDDWFPKTDEIAFRLANEQLNMINYAANKVGNEITLSAKGYKVLSNATKSTKGKAVLYLGVYNKGLSDQISPDI